MKKILDGATATAMIAYKLSQIIPIYPITPSSPMAEFASSQSAKETKNVFGQNVKVIEMQSEGGVSGTLHGTALAGSLSSTFTSSQGLLLMLPNLYKLAGENLPAVIHVGARAVASHALSIFGDHSDVMAARSSGVVMLASDSVQSSHDLALASHLLALKSSLPVLHFMDGFRTTHEIQKIDIIEDETIKKLAQEDVKKFYNRNRNLQFGTAQNPDTFFQNRMARETLYQDVGKNLQEIFDKIFDACGRKYKAFEFYGNKNAEYVIVAMGSACKTIEEYIDSHQTEKIGLVKVVLYRPFLKEEFLKILPKSVKTISVLDRTKESGSLPPLALDVISCLQQNKIEVLSGVYGLGGKEFTPNCVKAVYENMKKEKKNNFSVGIEDDLSFSSLKTDNNWQEEQSFNIKVFGLGSDGSVSASKSTIKILGKNTNKNVQAYFEYDSKKSGSLTQSHIRISQNEIKSSYLLNSADIISINNFSFVHRYNCLKGIKKNGVVLLNTIFSGKELDKVLPTSFAMLLKENQCKLYAINAQKIANEHNLGNKINIIMQTALFVCANLMPKTQILKEIEQQIKENFAIKGKKVVEKNIAAAKSVPKQIEQVDYSNFTGKDQVFIKKGNEFYNKIMSKLEKLEGDSLPVSVFNKDGSVPLDTSKYEKRGIALNLPQFIKENCIQCGMCTLACPHSALSSLLVDKNDVKEEDRKDFVKAIGFEDKLFRILLSPEDCTGCGVCARTCPAIKKALVLVGAEKLLEESKKMYQKYNTLPQQTQNKFSTDFAKGLQFLPSLFKFSGACAGCGQTAYIKILTMINGSNMMIANATGCSSIYSGSYGSCPFGTDENGQGITWANSLFEDNAEFGLGMALAEKQKNSGKKVWIIGGDGWAYDIGYGGLDHVLASGENVNILVLDNQSYSNTGGQTSKATPTGASIKFSEQGKNTRKKNLGLIALNYKDVFVAQIALGKDMGQTIKALKEAQEYDGPSLVIAYCPCVNQGYDLSRSLEEERQAVDCGFWPLYTYNPKTEVLHLQSEMDEEKYQEFLQNERRFTLTKDNQKQYLLAKQQEQAKEEFEVLKRKSENNK